MENKQEGETLQTTEAVGVSETELRLEVIQEMDEEVEAMSRDFDMMKEMEGQEFWTDAFGERICVGIEDGKVMSEGKTFKPIKKQVKEMWDDHVESELGSPAEREANLRAEFTPEVCSRMREEEIAERIQKKKEELDQEGLVEMQERKNKYIEMGCPQ